MTNNKTSEFNTKLQTLMDRAESLLDQAEQLAERFPDVVYVRTTLQGIDGIGSFSAKPIKDKDKATIDQIRRLLADYTKVNDEIRRLFEHGIPH